MIKTVYKYDPDSFEYIEKEYLNESDISPLGDWNIPAYCTEKPIEKRIGYKSVFNEELDEWNYILIEKPKKVEPTPEETAFEKYMDAKYEPVFYKNYWHKTNEDAQSLWLMAVSLSETTGEVDYKVYTDKDDLSKTDIIKMSRDELLELGSIVREKQIEAYKKYKSEIK